MTLLTLAEFLHSHFKKHIIEDLISEHTFCFTDTVLDVEVSTGQVFKPMRLQVHVFTPKTLELLHHARLTTGTGSQQLILETPASAPVGIMALESDDMRKTCNKHVEDMIKNKKYAAQVAAGDSTRIPRSILEVILQFCSTKEHQVCYQ